MRHMARPEDAASRERARTTNRSGPSCQDRSQCRSGRPTRRRCSRRSARPTTGSGRSCRSAGPRRWRRLLVSRLPRDSGQVLDVATDGPGRCRAARPRLPRHGLDQSPTCSPGRGARFDGRVELVEASADAIPFPDAVVRPPHLHVPPSLRRRPGSDPRGARARRPPRRRGRDAGVRPAAGVWRPPWNLWVDVGLPVAGRLIFAGLACGRRFLGPSIRSFHERYPRRRCSSSGGRRDRRSPRATREPRRRPPRVGRSWPADDAPRSLDAGLLRAHAGGWRDYVTLLHVPYTRLAPRLRRGGRLSRRRRRARTSRLTVLAFALAMGVGAHARRARRPPLDQDPSRVLVALAVLSVAAACAIGIAVALETTLWLLPLIAVGASFVARVQLELLGGARARQPRLRARLGHLPRRRRLRRASGHHPGRSRPRRRLGDDALLAQRRLSTQVQRVRARVSVSEEARRLGGRSRVGVKLLAAYLRRACRRARRASAVTTATGLQHTSGPPTERGRREDGRSEPPTATAAAASAAPNAMPAEPRRSSRCRARRTRRQRAAAIPAPPTLIGRIAAARSPRPPAGRPRVAARRRMRARARTLPRRGPGSRRRRTAGQRLRCAAASAGPRRLDACARARGSRPQCDERHTDADAREADEEESRHSRKHAGRRRERDEGAEPERACDARDRSGPACRPDRALPRTASRTGRCRMTPPMRSRKHGVREDQSRSGDGVDRPHATPQARSAARQARALPAIEADRRPSVRADRARGGDPVQAVTQAVA